MHDDAITLIIWTSRHSMATMGLVKKSTTEHLLKENKMAACKNMLQPILLQKKRERERVGMSEKRNQMQWEGGTSKQKEIQSRMNGW